MRLIYFPRQKSARQIETTTFRNLVLFVLNCKISVTVHFVKPFDTVGHLALSKLGPRLVFIGLLR